MMTKMNRWQIFDGVCALICVTGAVLWHNPYPHLITNILWEASWWVSALMCVVSMMIDGTGKIIIRLRKYLPVLLLSARLR